MPDFVHLHLHTQYSILDGACGVKPLMERVKELGMSAVAITDHGNMFGVKEFHAAAKRAGVKPILGCEVYVVKNRKEKDKDEKAGDHLVLLAKNLEGYHNLMRLVSYSWTQGFYYKPRIDKELLKEFHEGLICCSACLGGEIPGAIMRGDREGARRTIEEFREIFGEDFYLEMMLHPAADAMGNAEVWQQQSKVNPVIVELAKELGVKYIASNDVHFIHEDDAPAHDRLICLNTNADVDDPRRMRYTGQEWLKSPDEMAALFPGHPEALATTLEIADKIGEYSLDRKPLMPRFPLPDEFAPAADASEKEVVAAQFRYLQHLSYQGAEQRYGAPLADNIKQRIDYELKTIEWMGFPGYFLIVWDFIRAAREMGVSVGPGRGSAAGSVVAYALRITNIDPIKYDLLFERFLNPDRISLPDVDIDFDEDGRAKVLAYVTEKYGRERVAQIVTFGSMAPKLAIRDVARVQKLPLAEADRLAKLVSERPGTTFKQAYKESPDLARERESSNTLVRDTLRYAEKLEGSVRQTGVHACGVIIGSDDLEKFVPIAVAKDAELNVVQYEGKLVEDVGLIKMDFLGLKTLSIIKDAVENISLSTGETIDIDSIPLDDPLTYELYARGDTTGLFQFESPGMKKHLRNLRPNRFDDLIAMNALYRPGPMEYIPSFIERKHGRERVTYDLPEMEELLADTYGVTVYQEQVMRLSQKLAGFTGGQADTLRKAMGKKNRKVLDDLKPQFLAGAAEKGLDAKICEKIWSDWEAFAEYAFNKSHSTCYAYISYQTAWLKAHYPSEYMAALLSRNLSDIKKISFFMDESKRMNIAVLGPDVNESYLRFTADKQGNIRFGLAAVKGVGEAAVQSILEERKEGKFLSIYDFFERINPQAVNKKTLENLILAGALDSLAGFHRSRFFMQVGDLTFLELLMRYGSLMQNERNNSQQSLFGGSVDNSDIQKPPPPTGEEWSQLELLSKEREVIGIYLSAHPLDDYEVVIKNFTNMQVAQLEQLEVIRGRDFALAGMVTSVHNLMSKTGKPYGRFTLEDYSGSYTFTLFDKDYEKFRPFLFQDYFLLVRGKVQPKPYRDGELEPRINSMMQLSEARETLAKEISISVNINELSQQFIDDFARAIAASKGNMLLRTRVVDPAANVSLGLFSRTRRVGLSKELMDFCTKNELNYQLM